MRKKYQSYRILSARTVSATGPRIFGVKGGGAPVWIGGARSDATAVVGRKLK